MQSELYWSVFLETGAPEMYLLYKRAQDQQEQCTA